MIVTRARAKHQGKAERRKCVQVPRRMFTSGVFASVGTTMKQCIRQGTGQGTSMLEGLHVSHCHCPRRKSTVQGKHADIKAKKDPASIHVHSDLLRVKQAAH